MAAVHYFKKTTILLSIKSQAIGFSKYSAEMRCGTVCAAATLKRLTNYIRHVNLQPDGQAPHPWLQLIAHFNPLFYDVEAARVLANCTLLASRVYRKAIS